MVKKKQHYVPVVYLKEFTDFDSRDKDKIEPFTYVFRRDSPLKSFKSAPRNIAFENNYYSLNNSDEDLRLYIENKLSELESRFSKILEKIKSSKNSNIIFSDEERFYLSNFIACFDVRVPSHKENIEKFVKDVNEIILDIMSSEPQALENIGLEYENKTNKKLFKNTEEIEQMREFIRSKKYQVKIDNGYVNSLAFSPIEEIVKSIYNMQWELLISPEKLFFCTSDNPIILYDRNHKSNFYGVGYRSSPTVELFFPLTPKICFHSFWKKNADMVCRVKLIRSGQVKTINNMTCDYSNTFIFSSNDYLQI